MNRRLIAESAIALLFACGAASAQTLTNTPDLLTPPSTTSAGANISLAPGPTVLTIPPVDLGGAGRFVILSKSGITNVPYSVVTGNVGTSPITGAADHLTCREVAGAIYSVNAAGPAPCSIKDSSLLTNAVEDMQTAYTDAAGRRARITELAGGNIGGLTLGPGVYRWSTSVTIPSDVALYGGSHSVWIFQIAKNLSIDDGKSVILQGFAQARNVFWQVAGKVTLGTTSHFEGIVLSKTLIAMKTGAVIRGRLLAQTAVTLEMNRVIVP
jgi:ice-binding like protein